MAATLRLANANASKAREYVASREAERRASMEILNAPAAGQRETEALCVICLEECDGDERTREQRRAEQRPVPAPAPLEALSCGHVFHRACISQWLQYRRCCPIDRLAVGTDEDTSGL